MRVAYTWFVVAVVIEDVVVWRYDALRLFVLFFSVLSLLFMWIGGVLGVFIVVIVLLSVLLR